LPDFVIVACDWATAEAHLRKIRQKVFVEEQAVPPALEWDGLDAGAQHLLAIDAYGQPIGCARILASGHIGRMAVLPEWRAQGAGAALLASAIDYAIAQGWTEAKLSAQTHAIGFYEKAGFTLCSDTYLDAGIPHRDMSRVLST
jgi:predicted GNAT family N-acyltransferase